MKDPTINNLPTQTGDVIINPGNPENPDTKRMPTSTKMQPCQEKSKRSHPGVTTFPPKPETLSLIL